MKNKVSFFSGKPFYQCLMALLFLFPVCACAGDRLALDEQRFRLLTAELRCLVCQNQSIADSSAALAVDLRAQIIEQMAAGKTDDEIRAYMVSRYGDFILYSPPLKASTVLLWAGPFALLAMALCAGFFMVRRRATVTVTEDEEKAPLASHAEALWQRDNEK